MKKLFFTCCVLFGLGVNAQKEAANWYFGDNAGLNFNLDIDATSPLSDGQLATDEGCTSISDSNGNLLFYTDGRTVYNAVHNIMPNGTGLKGDPSSTQSAIIIPKPDDPNIYYIFTVDTPALDNIDLGFNYYEVNMALNGGLGDVVDNTGIQLLANTTEKLSAVLKDCETEEVWVITFGDTTGGESNRTFFAYLVTNTGVSTTPVTTNIGPPVNEVRGYLKFSPDGTKLASANVSQGLSLFDFDVNTGTVSNLQNITIDFNSPNGVQQQPYGVEFSPDNNLLYVSTYRSTGGINNPTGQYGGLLQYNLTVPNISLSQVIIDERQTYRGGLQLGPNGKLYRAMSDTYDDGNPFLSVVNNPNAIGMACNYEHNAIALTADSRQGLPPFITSFFSENIDIIQNGSNSTNLPLCDGDNYTLMADDIPGATYTWTLDGVLLSETDFDLDVTGPGLYKVEIEVNDDDCGLLEGIANVAFFQVPVATQPDNMEVCDIDNNGISTFDFSGQDAIIIDTQDDTVFEVKYYASMADATSNANEIITAYDNISNPQTIYAVILNSGNRNCYDLTTFNIEVFDTPSITSGIELESCDSDTNPMDGFTQLTLSDFDSDVLDNQDASQFSVTYYSNMVDANAGMNALPNNYTNQTAINDTIFVRVENIDNNSCFATNSINITINPIPEAFDIDIYQCDEQGMVDGFTTFNLTEVNDALTGNTPDRSTLFYTSLIDAQNDTNAVNGNAYDNVTNPETIYVRVVNNTTGCFNISELTLETSDTQINDYSAAPVCDEPGNEDGRNIFNLDTFSADILAGLPAGLNIAYYETANDALLENNELSSPYQNTTPYSQTIYVRVENDNACYGINEVLITVNPLPNIDNDETVLYCLNDFPQTKTIDAGLNEPNSGNFSFNWSTAETTESIDINAAGNYTITVTNNTTLCEKSRTITVEPSNIATIETIEVVDGSLNNNQITVITSGEGEYQYALMDQEGNQTLFQTSNVFSFLKPGIYSVIIRDIKNNCGTVEDLVSLIGFPLFFTPNNDGKNDTWQVYGLSRDFQPNSEILIFDRYGKLLTQIKPSSQGWDGTFNGNPLPQSDYWFTVTLQDGRVYRDHFTLKR